MTHFPSLRAALLALAFLTFGPASQANPLPEATSAIAGSSAFEAVGALASRVLEPSLRPANLAGSNLTDATAPPPSTVPEPEAFALLGLGLAAMVVAKRRKARKNG